jgi:predicted GIY-YIG superfamily endonuclease
MYYVYDLINSEDQTIYVGETKRPTGRMNDHRGKKKSPFHGRKDLSMVIISQHSTRKEALKAEGQRKLSLGMEWVEKTCGLKQDHAIRVANGKRSGCIKVTCPHCDKITNPGGIATHIKWKH